MIGKSGSMTGVVAYAGIVKSANGHYYAICIIINNHTESNSIVKKSIANWIEQQITL